MQRSLLAIKGSSDDAAHVADGNRAVPGDSSCEQPSTRQHGQRSLVKLRHGWRVFPQLSLLLWVLIVHIVPYPHKLLCHKRPHVILYCVK
jgi:hypothetical protein